MRLPFTNEEYKDKPVTLSWRHKSRRSRLFSKRILVATSVVLLCLYLLSSGTRRATGSGIDIYKDEDLHVDPTWFSTTLIASLAAAKRDKLARTTENVFILLNGLTESDTNLVSLGCQMSTAGEGAMVHFIVLGGGAADLDNYRRINQFDTNCLAFFHDARVPAKIFGDAARAYASFASNAVQHIVFNQKPKTFLFTHSKTVPKPNWFLAAIEPHRPYVTVIELTHETVSESAWMADLSPMSLNAWNKPRIDVIIDVSSHAGTLRRLLESLGGAKYPGNRLPLLLISLDPSSTRAVHDLVDEISRLWPPDKLLVRRLRSSNSLESWYPVNSDHYALFLRDTSELSMYYYQYLLTMLLRYRYGPSGRLGLDVTKKTYGITLQSSQSKDTSLRHTASWYDTLIYPNHYTAFDKAEVDWSSYVLQEQAVVISPGKFEQAGQVAALVRAPRIESDDPTVALTADDDEVLLLNQADWWTKGEAGTRYPFLDKLPLYDENDQAVSALEFFKAVTQGDITN